MTSDVNETTAAQVVPPPAIEGMAPLTSAAKASFVTDASEVSAAAEGAAGEKQESLVANGASAQ